MRCACPACGILMPQAEKALNCVCPHCGYICDACLGAGKQPLSPEAISAMSLTLSSRKKGRNAERRLGNTANLPLPSL